MLRVAIVDDERAYAQQLQEYIRRYAGETGLAVDITLFADGSEIVQSYTPRWDIIFLDIKMQDMDGMSAAKEIRKHDADVVLIFITMMAQFAVNGYQVEALDFVLKPVNYVQVATKMKKALGALAKRTHKYLMLPVGQGRQKVYLNDILYVEVKNHTLHIVTHTATLQMRGAMREAEALLREGSFARCHQAYLVNLKNVTGVEKEAVAVGGHTLPVSRPRKKQFLQDISDYLGEGYR